MSRNRKHIEDIFSREETPQSDELLAYVDGKLSPEAARRVEKAIIDDPMLSDAVDGIEEVGTEAFQDLMLDLDRALEDRLQEAPAGKEIEFRPEVPSQPESRPAKSRSRIFAIAAVIALLVAVGVVLNPFSPQGPGAIALDGYKGMSEPALMVGENPDQQSEYDRASALYRQGKFQEAAELYSKLPSSEAKLMAGHCHFQLEKYEQSAEFFRAAVQLDQGNRQDAEYNLALCYLQLEREKDAGKLLRNIAGDEYHIYHVQAAEVLERLGQ